MLTLQEIINEVDTLVPNTIENAKKVTWLNAINNEFFEVVKIPTIHQFTVSVGTSEYTLPNDVRSKNVVRVQIDSAYHLSMQYEQVNPGHNFWSMDDVTRKLQLNPTPSVAGKVGIVTYNKIGTTTFTTTNLTVKPDAPEEYHWIYVLGLSEQVAKAMNDVTLANNYGNDFREHLVIAQQNYGNRSRG